MEFFNKYKKGFRRLFIVLSIAYFAAFITFYSIDYQKPVCPNLISDKEFQLMEKKLYYIPTAEEVKKHEDYKKEVDQLYKRYEIEHGEVKTVDEAMEMLNSVKAPDNPLAHKGYFVEKGSPLYKHYEYQLEKYKRCNRPEYWGYIHIVIASLLIYVVTLITFWLIYTVVNWVVKGFRDGQ